MVKNREAYADNLSIMIRNPKDSGSLTPTGGSDNRGILICGANGSGKTTLGRALAGALGYKHMDAEDYYFPEAAVPFSVSRGRDEVIRLMARDIRACGGFVLSAVTGDFGDEITSAYRLAVCLCVPKEVRLARVRQRALDKYGARVREGGDMYNNNRDFIAFVQNRTYDGVDAFLQTLACPVLRLDGTRPIARLLEEILAACQPSDA